MFPKIFIMLVFGLWLLPSSNFSQGNESDAKVPEDVTRDVVSRILRWYFKPSIKPRAIYLLDESIKKEWLPDLGKIRFVLLPRDQAFSENERGIHFFRAPESDKGRYTISFGFGDPACDASGDTWVFQILDKRVRLWRSRYGWGSACGLGPVAIRN